MPQLALDIAARVTVVFSGAMRGAIEPMQADSWAHVRGAESGPPRHNDRVTARPWRSPHADAEQVAVDNRRHGEVGEPAVAQQLECAAGSSHGGHVTVPLVVQKHFLVGCPSAGLLQTLRITTGGGPSDARLGRGRGGRGVLAR
jgi:hypothetical protein